MTELAETTTIPDTSYEVMNYMQGLGIPEPVLEPLTAGCHSKIYVCEDPFPAFPQKVVVRVPECPEASRSIESNAMYLEDTPAPRTLHIGTLSLSGTAIVIEEFVEGSHKDFDSLTPKEICELATTLASVHSRTSDYFSNTSGGAPICSGTHGDYLQAMVKESVTDRLRHINMEPYVDAGRLIAAGTRKLQSIIEAQPALFSASQFSLLHHDLNPGNMLWGSDGMVRLIDWNTTFGDPADDVDYIITNNQVTQQFREIFFDAYCNASGRDDVLARVSAYSLKNQLDDLAWIMDMQERHPDDARYGDAAYQQRLSALESTLNF